MRIFRIALVCAALAATLGGCTVADTFSPRVVEFNRQAEQGQLQAILLNIVRASLNRPMQFTSLTSVTGTQSISGGGTLTTPFGEAQHRPKTTSSPDMLALTATVSAAPTFTVPVLDTQEFYQGELTPITGKEINFFIEEGYTPAQLFYLFVDSVELSTTGTTPAQHFTFQNHVGDDFDFDQFSAIADYLLRLGLTLESTRRVQMVGPELAAKQVQNLRDIADITTAGLTLMPARTTTPTRGARTPASPDPTIGAADADTGAPRKPAKARAVRPPSHYQLQKSTTDFRPCFDPQVLTAAGETALVDPQLVCESAVPGAANAQSDGNLARTEGIYANDLSDEIQALRVAQIKALRAAAANPQAAPKAALGDLQAAAALERLPPIPHDTKLQFKLLTRSTEGILYYLGSVVARHLSPGSDRATSVSGTAPRMIQVKVGEPYIPYPQEACPNTPDGRRISIQNDYKCDNLFVVEKGEGAPADAALVVNYGQATYWIPGDQNRQGRTMKLVDLVKQLLALHTSAKELPASNVLNIIGTP